MLEFTDNQPLVSVGIPTYNRPDGLRRTLEYITGQTYRNLEIIISNNCSPDPAVDEVIKSFINDSRIKYFKQPKNFGPTSNFRFVLEKSSGEYFMWASDDDGWHSEYVERLLSLLLEDSSCSVAFSNFKCFDLNGTPVDHYKPATFLAALLPLTTSNKFLRMFRHINYEPLGTASIIYGLIKRSILLEATYFLHDIFGSDRVFVGYVLWRGKLAIDKEELYYLKESDSWQSFYKRLHESHKNNLSLANYKLINFVNGKLPKFVADYFFDFEIFVGKRLHQFLFLEVGLTDSKANILDKTFWILLSMYLTARIAFPTIRRKLLNMVIS
jgi:glycosyltransferase involved in cell wall biosynthesis